MNEKVSAIILAAGKGERAGFGRNKLLAPLSGAPALYHTLQKFYTEDIDEVVVTSSKFDLKEISALCAPFGYKVVLGGDTRTQSVKNALDKVTGDIVLIHDGARPFVTKELIKKCIGAVKSYGSAICALKATDTAVYGHYGVICERLDRESMYNIQTPQAYLTDEIRSAYISAGDKVYTDDSAVYCEFIGTPRLIDGEQSNIKLTYARDFECGLPEFKVTGDTRVGFGVDVHCFGEGNSVILAGEKISCDRGLIAHSDGDVIAHAVMDALLSAAGLKDIGHYFPDTDEKFRGADSMRLLKEVAKIINKEGFAPSNISVSVQAEKPRLSAHIGAMTENLSKALSLAPENIAVAAGTCEGLGFVGEGLGITAYCAVTLKNIQR